MTWPIKDTSHEAHVPMSIAYRMCQNSVDHHVARIAELEEALQDCIPFLAIYMAKYATDFGEPAIHPTHAEIIDRVSKLTGGEPLSEKINPARK